MVPLLLLIRELWGFLSFLLLWKDLLCTGSGDQTTIELVTDSKAATSNLSNLGSTTVDCTHVTRKICELTLSMNIDLIVTWKPRELLADVDKLSKVWQLCDMSSLNPVCRRRIEKTWPHLQVIFPEFNQLKNLLSKRLCSSSNFNVVLIHPVWQSQVWWPTLISFRSNFIELGNYHMCFPNKLEQKPQWLFHASVL